MLETVFTRGHHGGGEYTLNGRTPPCGARIQGWKQEGSWSLLLSVTPQKCGLSISAPLHPAGLDILFPKGKTLFQVTQKEYS